MKYPALIDGEAGAYGVSFPDLPGIVAMGYTLDEAMRHAEEALQDYVIESEKDGLALTPPSTLEDVEVPHGCKLTSVTLFHRSHDRQSAVST
jgi:predicted RNase H-like HicB family nuclease